MRVVFVTAGKKGGGHFSRGVAIGRALARRGFRGSYRMLGPPLPFAAAQREDYRAIDLDRAELEDPRRAPTSSLARAIAEEKPDIVIVDWFWMPLCHVLPALRIEAWLLVQACPIVWFAGPSAMPFDAKLYRRIIGIEPFAPQVVRERIDPVVVCNPDECRGRGALRALLDVPAGRKLVCIVHAGERGESAVVAQQVDPNVRAHVFDMQADAPYPLAEWLGDADAIYCGGGYNTVWEAHWLGYAGRAKFMSFPRRGVEDQAARIRTHREYVMKDNGADTLASWMIGAAA